MDDSMLVCVYMWRFFLNFFFGRKELAYTCYMQPDLFHLFVKYFIGDYDVVCLLHPTCEGE